MREAHPTERETGVAWYVSDGDGTGGRLRESPEDFRVRELETIEPKPADGPTGDYPHVLVRATLRGRDTNDFVGLLSDRLGISRERVSWAGTKDKHAVTTQLFSIQGVDTEAVEEVADGLDSDVAVVGRYGRALEFGDLAGNAFAVRVREATHTERVDGVLGALSDFAGDVPDLPLPDAVVELGAERDGGQRVETVAVPNVFGHQRFGSRRPVTHVVGLHVVRGEWREAVLSYTGNPAAAEPERTQAARETVDEQAASADPDWTVALDGMPGYLGYERSMLHRLDERDVDADSPDEDWRHALEAVPTNLQRMFVNAAQSYVFNRILSERLERGLPFDRPVEGDVVCFTDSEVPEGVVRPDTDRLQDVTERRVSVVERHCARGRAFVTAPLVGTETELGSGEPGDIEREVLDDLDLSPADFSLPGAFDSTGTRRAISVRTALAVERDPLTFRFALPSGSYATALLREFLKADPQDL